MNEVPHFGSDTPGRLLSVGRKLGVFMRFEGPRRGAYRLSQCDNRLLDG